MGNGLVKKSPLVDSRGRPNVEELVNLLRSASENRATVLAVQDGVDVRQTSLGGQNFMYAQSTFIVQRAAAGVALMLSSFEQRRGWDCWLEKCEVQSASQNGKIADCTFSGMNLSQEGTKETPYTISQLALSFNTRSEVVIAEVRKDASSATSKADDRLQLAGWVVTPITQSQCCILAGLVMPSAVILSGGDSNIRDVDRAEFLAHKSSHWLQHMQNFFSHLEPLSFRPASTQNGITGKATNEKIPSQQQNTSPIVANENGVLPAPRTGSNPGSTPHSAGGTTTSSLGAKIMQNCGFSWVRGPLIGQGAMGKVYMGMQTDTGVLMAVKQISTAINMESAAEEMRSLQQEVQMFSRLRHPNIVTYLGVETTSDGTLSVFLEYLPGGSLQSLLAKFGAFKEPLVRLVMRQVVEGLSYLHLNDVIHRDIKAGNIVCGDLHSVKLADFGAAKSVLDQINSSIGVASLVGTPYMMAPEVIKQSGHDSKADIWSLGCLCLELLTGKPPWANIRDRMAAMFTIANTRTPPPFPPGISTECESFLSACLQIDPKSRQPIEVLSGHPFLQVPQQFEKDMMESLDRSERAKSKVFSKDPVAQKAQERRRMSSSSASAGVNARRTTAAEQVSTIPEGPNARSQYRAASAAAMARASSSRPSLSSESPDGTSKDSSPLPSEKFNTSSTSPLPEIRASRKKPPSPVHSSSILPITPPAGSSDMKPSRNRASSLDEANSAVQKLIAKENGGMARAGTAKPLIVADNISDDSSDEEEDGGSRAKGSGKNVAAQPTLDSDESGGDTDDDRDSHINTSFPVKILGTPEPI